MAFDDFNQNQVIDDVEMNPVACRALWCAVIWEQWNLVFAAKSAEKEYEIDRAERWFGSRDFFMTCALAGVDGAVVLQRFRDKLAVDGRGRATCRQRIGTWGKIKRQVPA